MPKLSQSIVSPSKWIVRERRVYIECLLSGHSHLQLVLCSCICYDFEVVNTTQKWSVWDHSTEVVIGFIKECMSEVWGELYFLAGSFWIPAELIILWQVVYTCQTHTWLGFLNRILLFFIRVLNSLSGVTNSSWVLKCEELVSPESGRASHQTPTHFIPLVLVGRQLEEGMESVVLLRWHVL